MRLSILAVCLAMLLQNGHGAEQIHVSVKLGENWQRYSLPVGATLSQLADVAKLQCDLKDSDDTLWRYDVSRKEADQTEKHRFKPDELKSPKGAAFVLQDGDMVSLAMILTK